MSDNVTAVILDHVSMLERSDTGYHYYVSKEFLHMMAEAGPYYDSIRKVVDNQNGWAVLFNRPDRGKAVVYSFNRDVLMLAKLRYG